MVDIFTVFTGYVILLLCVFRIFSYCTCFGSINDSYHENIHIHPFLTVLISVPSQRLGVQLNKLIFQDFSDINFVLSSML